MYLQGGNGKRITRSDLSGCRSKRDLKTSLGVSEQCGIGACHAKELLDQKLVQKSQVQDFISQSTCMSETAA